MYFTTLWSKMTAISSQKNCFAAIWRKKNVDPRCLEVEKNWFISILSKKTCFAAILREKNVNPCDLEPHKCISQLFGAR